MTALYSFGLGVGTQNKQGDWLEVFYPTPELNPAPATAQALSQTLAYTGGNQTLALTPAQAAAVADALDQAGHPGQAAAARAVSKIDRRLVATLHSVDHAPASVPEALLNFLFM